MKYFLDCGSHIGEGYEEFLGRYGNDYNYMLFEPNEKCCKILNEKYGNRPNVKIFHNAVYKEECTKTLEMGSELCIGATIIEGHNSGVNFNKKFFETIKCIDISKIINELAIDNNEIVMKINIESSEYDVLEHMIETGTIFKTSKIYCDFHSRYMNAQDRALFLPREAKILEYVRINKINFEIWH